MTIIDAKKRKPHKKYLKNKIRVYHSSEIDPKLSGFKRFNLLTNKEGFLYSDEIYEKGTGKVNMTDLNKQKRTNLSRYKPAFRPPEIWLHGPENYGPGSDLFALGITIYHLFNGKGPDTLNTTCLLYTSPSPRDLSTSRMPSSA